MQADIPWRDQARIPIFHRASLGPAKRRGRVASRRGCNFYRTSPATTAEGAEPISQLAPPWPTEPTGCRVVPGPRPRHRPLRTQPQLLLLQRHGSRVRCSARSTALGDRHAGPLRRRERSQKLKLPRADLRGPCTPRRWPSTTSAPRCRRCAPPTNANSLHQRAYDGAVDPTAESRCVGRWRSSSSSTQWGLAMNENPLRGQLHRRGSSPTWSKRRCWLSSTPSAHAAACSGAMETGYQRGRIQDEESVLYEHRKARRGLPIVGGQLRSRPGQRADRRCWPGPLDRRGEGRPDRPRARLPGRHAAERPCLRAAATAALI